MNTNATTTETTKAYTTEANGGITIPAGTAVMVTKATKLHLHTNIADPTADYTWSCVWESGSCPACAERKRIVAWLHSVGAWRLADDIESGAK